MTRRTVRGRRSPPRRDAERRRGRGDVEETQTAWQRLSTGTKAVLSFLGLLLAVVGGIAALWPDPDPADIVRFSKVRIEPRVPLMTFRLVQAQQPRAAYGGSGRRPVVAVAAPVGGLLAQVPDPSPEVAQTAEASPSSTPGITATPTGSASPSLDPTATETSATATATGQASATATVTSAAVLRSVAAAPNTQALASFTPDVPLAVPATPPDGGAAGDWAQLALPIVEVVKAQTNGPPAGQTDPVVVAEIVEGALATCSKGFTGPCTTTLAITLAATGDQDGEAVPQPVAARRLEALARTLRVTGSGPDRDIMGAVVDFDMEFVQLRDTVTSVTWRLERRGSRRARSPLWLATGAALKLKPTTDHDVTHQRVFVPLPRQPGPYRVTLDAWVGGSPVAHARSKPFE